MKKQPDKKPPAITRGTEHTRDGRGFIALACNGGRVRSIPPVD